MRLIDADAVLVWFAEYWSMQKKLGRPSKQQRGIYMAMRSMVNSRPTVDAVPVIRCKGCKYYRDGDCWHERENDRWIYYQSIINEPNPDDYCSRAERKEE